MAFVPVTPADYQVWGKLVMSWSTGTNFVNGTGAAGFPAPPGAAFADNTAVMATMAQFNAAVAANATHVAFPATVTEIVFVRDTATRRYVRLPQSEMVTAAFQQLQAPPATYQLPAFYLRPPVSCANPAGFAVADLLTLQAERVGDYSISSCM